MKKSLVVVGLMVAITFWLLPDAKAADTNGRDVYEYASFSSMGTKSSIIWPDGSVLRIEDKYKRPSEANEKMFYTTMAFNIFAREGYDVFSGDTTPTAFNAGHESDLIFRRKIK